MVNTSFLTVHASTLGAGYQNDNLQLGTFVMHDDTELNFEKTAKDQFHKDDAYWDNNTLGGADLTKTKLLIREVGSNKRIK